MRLPQRGVIERMSWKKRKKWVIPLAILLVLAVFFYCQINWIKTSKYTITSAEIPQSMNGYKILLLSDLHSKRFGPSNNWLLRRIRRENPDIIVATGDMLNSTNDDGAVFLQLAQDLKGEFPIYYIDGNHERIWQNLNGAEAFEDYVNRLQEAGVTYIKNQSITLWEGEQPVTLSGVSVPLMYYRDAKTAELEPEKVFDQDRIASLLGQADEGYHIFLAHTPQYFPYYAEWGADLVLCGHMHGGIVYIPFVGGLLSPEKTFFPKYYRGLYREKESNMIVSAGLGNNTVPFRLLNRPEICAITLEAAS